MVFGMAASINKVLSGFGRPVLALIIVGTIPLSMWAQGCTGSRPDPMVQPDGGTGGRAGSVYDAQVNDLAGDMSTATDALGDGAATACCGPGVLPECVAGGASVRSCMLVFGMCHADAGMAGYGYVWTVQNCANGCIAADAGAGGASGNSNARCGL